MNDQKTLNRFFPKALLFCVLACTQTAFAVTEDSKLFEQIDPEAEKQRLVEKYTTDKERLSSAIQNTKELIRKSQGKKYLPELYIRLAELYIEKSRIAYMEIRLLNGPDASDITALESRNLKLHAIEIYQRILNVYPKFTERDKVHFYLAHEFKELGRIDEMLNEYAQIIQDHPKSKFAPEALLLTGDHYFGLADTAKSRSYYERVLAYEGHSAAIIARYKLAWVHINLKDFKTAVNLFIDSITDANTQQEIDVDTYDGLDIRQESLIDLAFVYPDHFKKEKANHAIELFRELSWSRTAYLNVLEKVGSRLRVRKQWPRALEVYRELIKLENDPAALIQHAHHLFESYQQVKDNNLKAMSGSAGDIQMLVRALRLQATSVYIEDKDKLESETSIEAYTRDIATNIHKRAKASGKAEDFGEAAQGYEAYLAWFDNDIHTLQMQLNLADSLYNSGDFFGSAIAYEKASENPSLTGADKESALYSSLHSYQSALKSPDPMNHLQILQARSGLVATGQRHLAEYPGSKHSTEVEFNIAWTRYDEGEFTEAVNRFTDFLRKHPRGELANAAIELTIDSFQITEDWAGLTEFTQVAMGIPGISNTQKSDLSRLATAAQEKIVGDLAIAALDDWEDGAQQMLDYANDHPSANLGAQALGSLMALSQEKHDLRTLQVAATNAINKAPQSETAQSGLKMMIDASLKSGNYRLLQESLNQYAELYPADSDSKDFLIQSAQIQQRLGMNKEATATYAKYIRQYSPKGSDYAAAVMGIAEIQLSLGQERDAISTLMDARKRLPASQRQSIDALSGLLLLKRGDRETAAALVNTLQQGKATGRPLADQRSAQLLFAYNEGSLDSYGKLNLRKGIDPAVLQAKTNLLQSLTAQYQTVLKYNVPKWSAASMYRLAYLNENYANFLLEAPVPADLSDAERTQYVELIKQQAAPYQQESARYFNAGKDLVTRLGLLDKSLQSFEQGYASFSSDIPMQSYRLGNSISAEKSLRDENLYGLHQTMLISGKNDEGLLELSQTYFARGDYNHALMIATQYGEGISPAAQSELTNLAGVVYFKQGNIESARSAFLSAVQQKANNYAALSNLASLYSEYGAKQKAGESFSKLPPDWQVPDQKHQRISIVSKHFNAYKREMTQQ